MASQGSHLRRARALLCRCRRFQTDARGAGRRAAVLNSAMPADVTL